MLQMLMTILMFLLVLFIYIHIRYHLKTNNDLDVIDLTRETIGKDRLEDICMLRSPVKIKANIPFNSNVILDKFKKYSVNLRKHNENINIPIKLSDAIEFLNTEKGKGYYSDNNSEFINETLLKNEYDRDDYFRPVLSIRPEYDLIFGNKDTVMPIQYKNSYKHFIVACNGKCRLRLFNPNSIKYLNIERNYDRYEFSNCKMNAFLDEIDKTQYVDVELNVGETLYIPKYWSYSIKFDEFTVIAQYLYNTPMSFLSVSGDIIRYLFQQQNIKTKIA
jgi:hypothetical protein